MILILCYRTFLQCSLKRKSDTSLTRDDNSHVLVLLHLLPQTPEFNPALPRYWDLIDLHRRHHSCKKKGGEIQLSLPLCPAISVIYAWIIYHLISFQNMMQICNSHLLEIPSLSEFHDLVPLFTVPFSSWSYTWPQWAHRGLCPLLAWGEFKGKAWTNLAWQEVLGNAMIFFHQKMSERQRKFKAFYIFCHCTILSIATWLCATWNHWGPPRADKCSFASFKWICHHSWLYALFLTQNNNSKGVMLILWGEKTAWKRIPEEFTAHLPLFLSTKELVLSVISVNL